VPAVLDGDFYPASPVQLYKEGNYSKVPLLIGSNTEEGSRFVDWSPQSKNATASNVQCALDYAFGQGAAAKLANVFPVVQGADNRMVYVKALTDSIYACEARRFARSMTQHGGNAWTYAFARHMPTAPWPGAFHTQEIMYVFDRVKETFASVHQPSSAVDEVLGHKVAELWAHFASDHKASWTQFSLNLEETIILDVSNTSQFSVENNYRRPQCEALEALPHGMDTPGDLGHADMIFSALRHCQSGQHAFVV